MKRTALAIAFLLASCAVSLAQSGCSYIAYGAVLTPAQWNFCFSSKQNMLGFTPLNIAGGTMLGLLTLAPSTASSSGLNVAPGVAPTSPNNGDTWVTASGMYTFIAGETVGPLNLTPVVTVTGASDTSIALFTRTRRSNSGSAMTDTLPAATALLVNGTRMQIANVDASASDTISAGAGTTILGGSSFVLGPGRDLMLTYDLTNTAWRAEANTSTALLGPNNLSDVGSKATAQNNLFPSPTRTGDIIYYNGSNWVTLAGNNSSTLFLQETASGVPSWAAPSGSGTVNSGTTNYLAYYASSTNAVSPLATCNNGLWTTTSGGVPICQVDPLTVAQGGTGNVSATANSIPVNNGTSAQNAVGPCAVGSAVVGQGSGSLPTCTQGPPNTLATLTIPAPSTATISIATPAVVTMTNTFVAGQAIVFSTTGALPTGITAGTLYYVSATGLSGSSFQFSTTLGGSSVATSGSQSGTQSVTQGSLIDTTHFTSSFTDYELVLENVAPVTNGTTLSLIVFSNGAWQITSYVSAAWVGCTGGTAVDVLTTGINLSNSTAAFNAAPGTSGSVTLYNANSTVNQKHFVGTLSAVSSASTSVCVISVGGFWNGTGSSANAVTGIQVQYNTGAILTTNSPSIRIKGQN